MGKEPQKILDKLKTKNTVLIDFLLAKKGDYSINDKIQIFVEIINPEDNSSETKIFNLKIVGIIRVLPGVPEDAGIWGDVYNLYIDINTVSDFQLAFIENYKILIDVASGYDENEIASQIENKYLSPHIYIQVKERELEEILENPMVAAPLIFLNIEFAFIIMIISIGLGLLMYVASIERRREIAGIIARGASHRQIKQLFFGEALTIMIFSVIVGLSVGLITSFAFNSLISVGESVIQRELILSITTFSIILIPIICLIVTAYIVSYQTSKMELNKALRLRGG
jgi:ABC-type antimicrobial peptide transport system permease subunit